MNDQYKVMLRSWLIPNCLYCRGDLDQEVPYPYDPRLALRGDGLHIAYNPGDSQLLVVIRRFGGDIEACDVEDMEFKWLMFADDLRDFGESLIKLAKNAPPGSAR